jgi:drug/metabolite transporter (DMT)-like permease
LMNGALSINAGLLWLLLAALLLSAYNLLQRKLTRTYTALQASTYSIFFGTLLLAVFAPRAFREASQAPAAGFVCLAVMGICSSAVSYVAWSKAFAKAAKTSQVSNYMFITPF